MPALLVRHTGTKCASNAASKLDSKIASKRNAVMLPVYEAGSNVHTQH